MNEPQKFETQWGGKTLSIEVGKYAQQAGGSCVVQYGDTVVLATATMSSFERPGLDYFPLMVDFEEKLYAAGRIKGSRFMKKEGRPTDEAVLVSRTIDRALRPLFDSRLRKDIQVIVTNLSFDGQNDPDVIGLIASSCALHISDIPWNGPIGTVRVGHVDGAYVLNPTYEQRESSKLDLMFSGDKETVIMVEAGANEATEEVVLGGFWFGQEHMDAPIKLIEEVRKAVGKEKLDVGTLNTDKEKALAARKEEVEALARPFIVKQVQELFFGAPQATKGERSAQKDELKTRTKAFLTEQGVVDEELGFGTGLVHEVLEHEISRAIVEDGKRVDGRGITEIRNLVAEIAVLPRVHGTGHFMRGETQVLTVVTLGAPGDEQTLDGMETVGKQRYFHHYNFPPFSVGEVKPMRGPSRRDIGHGGLAEKALMPMMPGKETFPYTIRAVSEVFGSNGSSSMGSTCGSTLSLMDAGVPIKAPVAGIAMGLAMNDAGDWKVITDLQDLEDGKGGMDFKIAGSREGITAIQMDTKTAGLSREIVKQTFEQAKEARMQILDVMAKTIAEPRAELSPYAPRIITLRINPEMIGNVIGPGGKTINEIIETTGVQAIDIEDDGLVMITSTDAAGAELAKARIEALTKEAKVGEVYKGKVTRIMDFGAIVEFLPKRDGMVHVSMMAPWRVEKVTDIVKMGDEVFVKLMEISPDGKTSLSMKDAPGNKLPEKPKYTPRPEGDRDRRGPGSRSGGRPGGSRPAGDRRPPAPRPPRTDS
ncbi:polyribonucleotide nucleotidyltransferase [Candidatus Uhrbacteria bacterium CG_4_9_14_3_um_filter_50_9]|uniref:Polyribonucleotide nucleotidyltransferase n=1 Tax=Candidatus Uhrbacteria bacterium CG_4_9_14_3_um_filter_50_9 TaxID=1975035 RepID=A0A2M7XBH2_9BACT|nr:MAG: polyribonucleotide nucleotidyltransferase [Candidatus Uhrbacteria bacterium CG_4_9_14_3_um_filter_50_9]